MIEKSDECAYLIVHFSNPLTAVKKLVFIPFLLPAVAQRNYLNKIVWFSFRSLVGKWTGESQGQPGRGNYERSYEFIMNKKFIEVKNN